MKKLFSLMLILAMLITAASAVDVDMSYSGPLDAYTGQPAAQTPAEQGAPVSDRVMLTSTMYYDRSAHEFSYVMNGVTTAEIFANVADGMITTDPVQITLPEGLHADLYCDGVPLTDVNYDNITAPGKYVLIVSGQSVQEYQMFAFTIVNWLTGAVVEYQVPSGFTVSNVTRDGENAFTSLQSVDLEQEGRYVISYRCDAIGMNNTLEITVDHTPPKLALEAVDENGHAFGPVDISDIEEDATIQVYCDGEPVNYSNTLTRSGLYRLELQDKAGNQSVYEFIIHVYFNLNSWIFFGLAIAVVAAVVIYLIVSRKRLRVR